MLRRQYIINTYQITSMQTPLWETWLRELVVAQFESVLDFRYVATRNILAFRYVCSWQISLLLHYYHNSDFHWAYFYTFEQSIWTNVMYSLYLYQIGWERTSWLITCSVCLIFDIKVYHFIVYNLAILGNIWYVTDWELTTIHIGLHQSRSWEYFTLKLALDR